MWMAEIGNLLFGLIMLLLKWAGITAVIVFLILLLTPRGKIREFRNKVEIFKRDLEKKHYEDKD